MLGRFLRSKLFISVVLLFLAALIAFWALPRVTGAKSETTQVVQFVSDVKEGTLISDAMLVVKEIGKYGIDASAITDKADVIGKYAVMDIHRSTPIYSDQFTEELYEVGAAIDSILKPTDRLVVLSLENGATSVGAQIRPGSVVDVYTRLKVVEEQDTDGDVGYYGGYGYGNEELMMELQPLLTRVVVYKIQNNALEDITELQRRYKTIIEANDGSEDDFDSSLIPAYVTLIVSDDQADELVQQEKNEHGAIHLVLHPTETYTEKGVVDEKGDVIERVTEKPVEPPAPEHEEDGEDPVEGTEDAKTQPEPTPAPITGGAIGGGWQIIE